MLCFLWELSCYVSYRTHLCSLCAPIVLHWVSELEVITKSMNTTAGYHLHIINSRQTEIRTRPKLANNTEFSVQRG